MGPETATNRESVDKPEEEQTGYEYPDASTEVGRLIGFLGAGVIYLSLLFTEYGSGGMSDVFAVVMAIAAFLMGALVLGEAIYGRIHEKGVTKDHIWLVGVLYIYLAWQTVDFFWLAG